MVGVVSGLGRVMGQSAEQPNSLVVSYLMLRRLVGGLGVLLPVLMVVGARWFGPDLEIRSSISSYYDSVMRDFFVGILFAIGVFLYAYRGYEPKPVAGRLQLSDNITGNLAAVFALGVALLPTDSPNVAVGGLHLVSASLLFLTLSYFSLKLFTKTKAKGEETAEKLKRNRVYVACGVMMLVCIAGILVYSLWFETSSVANLKPVFWLETLALWAFGVSWFVKGETLWRDEAS